MKSITLFIILLLTQVYAVSAFSYDTSEAHTFYNQQYKELVKTLTDPSVMPRTVEKGKLKMTRNHSNGAFIDWTFGFFPGSLWYLSQLVEDETLKNAAVKVTNNLRLKMDTLGDRFSMHDIGFIANCSYGNEMRFGSNKTVNEKELMKWAEVLMKRFDPKVGCIKSWDADKGWQAKRGWQYPVIIDNMMNLELLFMASELSGNDKYRKIAIRHAETTMKNHFREDNSSYHVIDYSPVDGSIRNKHTAQGFAHSSAWARGQAWGLYGFVMTYRYTKDRRFLDQAQKIARYILNHPRLPRDMVPYWDFDDTNIPKSPRDVSAASIISSALFELSEYVKNGYGYSAKANMMLENIYNNYRSQEGEYFALQHSVGSIPHGAEIDAPLSYADYYYFEAIYRSRKSRIRLGQSFESDSEVFKRYLNGDRSDLIDYSYAGYDFGDSDIPDRKDLKIFYVRDFGAKPDDEKSDFKGIQRTIAAAESNGGGVVQFDKGVYWVNEKEGSIESIKIKKSNIILRGVGNMEKNGTVLFMRMPLIQTNPKQLWTTPKMIKFSPERSKGERKPLDLKEPIKVGDKHIVFNSNPGYKIGDIVKIRAKGTFLNERLLDSKVTREIWTAINEKGASIDELAVIEGIYDNIITLRSPLLFDANLGEKWTIEKMTMLSNVAVENLLFKGNFQEKFVHHKNGYHDGGFSAIALGKCYNAWVKDVNFVNVSKGVHITGSVACTIKDCSILKGYSGHTSYGLESSTRCLTDNCSDYAGQWHGVNASHGAVGCVHYRSKGISRGIDAHASCPRYTLYDNVEGMSLLGNGGNYKNLPNHLKGMVVWNYTQHSEKVLKHDFWNLSLDKPQVKYLGLSAVNPIVIGYKGPVPEFKKSSVKYVESLGTHDKLPSLYEAQLKMR